MNFLVLKNKMIFFSLLIFFSHKKQTIIIYTTTQTMSDVTTSCSYTPPGKMTDAQLQHWMQTSGWVTHPKPGVVCLNMNQPAKDGKGPVNEINVCTTPANMMSFMKQNLGVTCKTNSNGMSDGMAGWMACEYGHPSPCPKK
jgi:hypothetical protein